MNCVFASLADKMLIKGNEDPRVDGVKWRCTLYQVVT